MDMIVILFNR